MQKCVTGSAKPPSVLLAKKHSILHTMFENEIAHYLTTLLVLNNWADKLNL